MKHKIHYSYCAVVVCLFVRNEGGVTIKVSLKISQEIAYFLAIAIIQFGNFLHALTQQ